MGELALSMATLAQRVAAHQLSDLQRGLQRLDRMAQNLGLKTLSVVTQDLAICLNRKDNTAFAAVWARLLRIADSALTLDALAHDIKDF